MSEYDGLRTSLDLTHVVYDASSGISLILAIFTLSPILLMPAYAALAVQTRELTIINMWAGQFMCEGSNWALKRLIKQERPAGVDMNGYGFPSSHSQFMGYFSTFLMCHLYFRHRFGTTGSPLVDCIWRIIVYMALIGWALVVASSRFFLKYHTPHQIQWGLLIGIALGITHYALTEYLPVTRPQSIYGRVRTGILAHPVCKWLQIRDGWAIWDDGGREEEWKIWRAKWDRRRDVREGKKRE